jgi:acetylornithine deacetylase/succinyl-diaminopimelate desuccinylase-like protein
MVSRRSCRFVVSFALAASIMSARGGGASCARAVESPEDGAAGRPAADADARLREAVGWLAAPEREGRGPGTAGIDQAAEWMAHRFDELGLRTRIVGEEPYQPFAMTLEATLGPADRNTAAIVGPPGEDGMPQVIPLELGKDFTPLAAGGSGAFDLPLVFGGFGITAPAEQYDDYAPLVSPHGHGSLAKGAALIVLRQEPQKDDPHSVFDGNQASQHAALSRKVANASEHEAGGLVFCNESGAEDDLMSFTRAGDGSTKRTMPVLHVRRAAIDRVVQQALGRDLASIEKAIDGSLEPHSGPLPGWRIRGSTAIERVETSSRNVLAMLPGVGAPAKDGSPVIDPRETVVLGAHYDHLGYGGEASAAPGEKAIHHGADDNASGAAMLVEVARTLRDRGPLPRTILFVAFSGEERGLLGSGHYTANAAVPLDDTVAMVNLDMVGRLADNKLIVHGTGTGTGFDAMVDRLVAHHGFDVAKEPGGFGPSDHSSFYAKKIPVLHVFTGSHSDYHRPTDTAEKIDYAGMVRIAGLVADAVTELAGVSPRPGYIEVASKQFARGGDRPYFGSIPDFGKPGGGYAISGVTKDSPAAVGGLQGGDLIIRLGDSAITGLEDFDSALRKHKADETIPVVVSRGGAEVTLQVTLGKPK